MTQYICASGHSFDCAKEGYVNLLVRNRKLSKTVGDSAAMLNDRRLFLESGHYAPLVQVLISKTSHLPSGGSIAELGCGTGYYLQQIHRHHPQTIAFGSDIAKDAVRLAAKTYPGATWLVADSSASLPFANTSIDLLLVIFAPRNPKEFKRITTPQGRLIIVIPAPSHLASIRQSFSLLNIEEDKEEKVNRQLNEEFTLVDREEITVSLKLDPPALQALIGMTPSARHIDPSYVAPTEITETEASFIVLSFEPRA